VNNLSQLKNMSGFLAAAEFNADGQVLKKEGHLDNEVGTMLADLCAANMRMGQMQARGFSKFSGLKGFEECKGFAVSGPSISLCVLGNIVVMVENSQCDFNEVFNILKTNN